jgi:membrane protease YdiL (CAAX protease family)
LQLLFPVLGQLGYGFFYAKELAGLGQGLTPEILQQIALVTFGVMIPSSLLVSYLVYRGAKAQGNDARASLAMQWPKLGWGGWFLAIASFFVVVGAAAVGLRYLSGDLTSQGEVEKFVMAVRNQPLAKILFPLSIGFAGPLAEEFLFRGPIFAKLVGTPLGRWGTVVATSAAWAVIHMTQPWIAILQIFVMGLGLGALLLRFGSIWVPVVCHMLWNLMTTIVLFNADVPQQAALLCLPSWL